MQYMRYQNFLETVKKQVKQTLHKMVSIQPVLKNNGTTYDGLIILDPLFNISPTIYLNSYYQRYLSGESLEEICKDIIKVYKDNLPTEDFDISIFQDYNKAKERIIMRLINAEKNQQLLQMVPHILIYDLAIVFLCNVSDQMNSCATILIYNQHLSMWDIDTDILYEAAKINSYKQLPPRLDNLNDVCKHITDESFDFLDELDIYILTNRQRIYGATCMIYPNLLEEIANIYEDDLIIMPSSIHEVLLFPKEKLPSGYSLEYLTTMVQTVNDTELKDIEILSDHIYYYNRKTNKITY